MDFKSESSARSAATPSAAAIDTIDMNDFLNLEQPGYSSPTQSSTSNSSDSRLKSLQTPDYSMAAPTNVFLPPQQPAFAGPSHQYDGYKQQTGLPMGAITKIPVVRAAESARFGMFAPATTLPSSGGYFGMSSVPVDDDEFDFNALPADAFNDMDFSPSTELVTPERGFVDAHSFVNPTAVGGNDDVPTAISFQTTTQRMYPGMHQQQAREAQRQQQMRAQRHSSQLSQSTRHGSTASRLTNDPIVEETISRILKEGRHPGGVMATDDGSAGQGHGRVPKPEEEMDPDEKLLASEEGKKLSSKERRQLRNKVSARAFRSRRKDYITQLEDAAALKAQETDKLRDENAALKAENARLTELSNLLLGSPSFQNFLEEMSRNPMSASLVQSAAAATTNTTTSLRSQAPPSQPPQAHPSTRKDPNPYASHDAHDAHIGFAFLPETPVDLTPAPTAPASWTNEMAIGTTANTSIGCWAVTSLPEGPAIDVDCLSGKSTTNSSMWSDAKDAAPSVDRMPVIVAEQLATISIDEAAVDETVVFDESNPAYTLFADMSPTTTALSDAVPVYRVFGDLNVEKAFARIELVVDGRGEEAEEEAEVSAATMARFAAICAVMEDPVARVARMTAHL